MSDKLKKQIGSFKGLWKGGYYEGNPLDPLARSTYNQIGYMSVLHATYLRCIKPYVKPDTVALEIGAGRGAWTKTLLTAKEIWALDALPADYNQFWDYVGEQPHLRYIQVEDFSCSMLPENYFNYLFSFGCLCHVSFEGIEAYAKNIFPKLKSGSNCFWLVADYDKYNRAVGNLDNLSVYPAVAPVGRRYAPIKKVFDWLMSVDKPELIAPDADDEPRSGRWYHAGIDRTCKMLEKYGYEIVDKDVETSLRDPIIHFLKP